MPLFRSRTPDICEGRAGLARASEPTTRVLPHVQAGDVSPTCAPLPSIPGVPVGSPLDFKGTPTLFTGADLMAILPAIRAGIAQALANADPTVQVIQITKQLTGANNGVYPADFPSPSALLHTSVGVQRRIARDFVDPAVLAAPPSNTVRTSTKAARLFHALTQAAFSVTGATIRYPWRPSSSSIPSPKIGPTAAWCSTCSRISPE